MSDLVEILKGMEEHHLDFANRMRTHRWELKQLDDGEYYGEPVEASWICADCRMELAWDGKHQLFCNLDNETCPAAVMKEALA